MGANKSDEQSGQRSSAGGKDRKGRGKQRRSNGSGPRRFDSAILSPSPELLATIDCPLDAAEFVVFDIETTGGNPERNAITEIFAIKFKNGEATDTYGTLVDPEMAIPPIVRRMTGITNAMVRGEPRISDVMPEFLKFVGSGVLVSHNTIGDIKFIRHFAKEVSGVTFDNFYMCTHLLVEKLTPEAPDKSLKGLAHYFKLASGELHRAEADTHVTLALFKVLLERLKGRNVRRVMDAVRLQGDLESALRLGWGVKPEALEGVPANPGVWKLFDHDQSLLFLSSAQLLDRDLSKLKSFDQLPKQLMRLVLRSSDLSYKTSPNLFSAMIEECDEVKDRKVSILPAQWHQRVMHALYVTDHAEGLCVDIGPLEEGTKYAFGPIRDRRQAQECLERLAEALNGRMTRRGLILPAESEETLVAFLQGKLKAEVNELSVKRRSIKLWFQPKERKQIMGRLEVLEKLLSWSKPKWDDLLNRHGAIVVPGESERSWEIYPVVRSAPLSCLRVSGAADAVRDTLFGGELSALLSAQISQGETRVLSADEANRANATLWWMFNMRGESRFIPLSELLGQTAS